MDKEAIRQQLLKAAQTVRDKQIFDIIKKFNNNEHISPREHAAIEKYLKDANKHEAEMHPKYGFLGQWATNKTEATKLLGLPRGALYHFSKHYADAPIDPANGTVNLWQWFDFMEKHGIKIGDQSETVEKLELKQDADRRKTEAQAALVEHRLQRLKAEVIPRDVVSRTYTMSIMGGKTKLLGTGNALAQVLAYITDAEEIRKTIDNYVWNALDEWSKCPFNGFECPHCKKEIKAEEAT